MITLKHLRKEYENATPLKDVNVTINKGDIISVIGPSGTGKSTLLRCINMLEKPTSGQIIINGQDITDKKCKLNEVRKKLGMVFQSFNLFGNLTIIENVMRAPMDLLGMSKQEAYEQAMELLHSVGLESKAFNYPEDLSGGQKQRVAIARTLSMNPDIILFDEPTSALDPTMVGEVQAIIRELAKSGRTMMIVTHEMKFAREICNRVFYMDNGGIYDDGTPEEIFDNPKKERTRRFIKRLKVFETEINGKDYDYIGASSSLRQYGYKNLIPPKTIYSVNSTMEELCMEILLPTIETPKILFTAEYDESGAKMQVEIKYNGAKFDAKDTENVISWKIVKARTENYKYQEIDEDGFTNQITFEIK